MPESPDLEGFSQIKFIIGGEVYEYHGHIQSIVCGGITSKGFATYTIRLDWCARKLMNKGFWYITNSYLSLRYLATSDTEGTLVPYLPGQKQGHATLIRSSNEEEILPRESVRRRPGR